MPSLFVNFTVASEVVSQNFSVKSSVYYPMFPLKFLPEFGQPHLTESKTMEALEPASVSCRDGFGGKTPEFEQHSSSRIEVMGKMFDIQTLIGKDRLVIDVLHPNIVFSRSINFLLPLCLHLRNSQQFSSLGKVLVDGKVITKAGSQISDKAVVEIMAEIPKGGHKLEAAIENLEIDVAGKVALDSGLSTGGFTDCLLQYGTSFVYGVDVGYGQVTSPDLKADAPKASTFLNSLLLVSITQVKVLSRPL
ncbi:putative haloalkane dehalogenase-like [Capsicum annuum]|nr:putative haloalkane dehalogenase-like [Capsicum annuum]KAF3680363.1 putative haloalkane dehalogenase-like [Capsicum annuum]